MFKKYRPNDPYVRDIYSIPSNPLTVFEGLWWVFCLVVSTVAEVIEGHREKVSFGHVPRLRCHSIFRHRRW